MKQIAKRGLSMLMAFVLVISLMPVLHSHTAHAAGTEVEYVYDGSYIYNWGTRGETATFLSPNAEAFYTGEYTYDMVSALPGGTSTSNAPSSALYDALQDLMVSRQTYQTSYDATKELFRYTDCENSAKTTNTISSFYSGRAIGPDWDGGNTWNREHTWPNSKGDASGNGENDIMMLRPTSMVENSSRGNTAYGESGSFYHPNSESNGQYDLRGDVARIMLYVYVRWGNTEKMWGSSGVIESLDVLLNWIETDPVDTWELGRNDSVQSITGTRNVFVDYPELAFLLFGAEIPENMATPSGEAGNAVSCQHNYVAGEVVAATCVKEGYTVYTCSLCGRSYNSDKTPVVDHTYVGGKCSGCGAAEPFFVVTAPIAGMAYKFGMIQEKVSATNVYYLTGAMSGYYMATTTDTAAAIDVYLEETTGGYYFYTMIDGVKTYINMVVSGEHVNGAYEAAASTVYTFNETSGTLVADVNGTPYWFGTRNDKTYTTVGPCATSYNGFYCQLYSEPVGDCEHTNTTVVGAADATCTEDGHTGKTVCADCGKTINSGAVIPSHGGHDYVEGVCSRCGEAEPEEGEAVTVTVSIGDYAAANGWSNSVKYTELKMDDTVTVTVSGGSNTGKYYTSGYNWRMYQTEKPSIVISAGDKTILTVKVTYTSDKSGALTLNGATVASGTVVDVNASSITFSVGNTGTATNGQARITAIEVVYAGAAGGTTEPEEPACEHATTTVEGASEATCTEAGHTGKTVCADCGETISEGEKIPALGHNYVDGVCTRCGAEEPAADAAVTVTVSIGEYAAANGWADTSKHTELKMDDTVTVTLSGSNNTGKYYNNGSNWRVYQTENPSIVISAGDKTIVSVKITYTNSNNGVLTLDGAKITSGTAVDVNASSVTFGVGNTGTATNGQVRITAIEVVYAGAAGGTTEPEEPACEHATTTVEGASEATCTEAGHTGKTICAACGEILSEGEEIPALGHNYVDGVCTRCGAEEPAVGAETTVTVTLADYAAANGWADGIKYTEMKMDGNVTVTVSGGDNTGKYYVNGNNWRIYQTENPSIVISAGDKTIVSVKITYSVTNTGVLTLNGTNVASDTVVDVNASSVTFGVGNTGTVTKGQVRITAIEVVYAGAAGGTTEPEEPVCEHTNTTVEGAIKATCTEAGHTGKTVCVDCGAVIDEGKEIPALGHTTTTVEGASEATCTEAGHTGKTVCVDCGAVVNEGEKIPALGHSYVDGVCIRCGAEEPLAAPELTVTNDAATGKIVLSWTEVLGAEGYEVYRATSKNGNYKKLTTTTALTVTNASIDAGDTYYYMVRAIKGETKGEFSESIGKTCDLARPTVTVTNDAATGKIVISWKEVPGASGYEVYRSTSKDGTYKKLTTTTALTVTNASISAGDTYYYRVKAIFEGNSGADSAASVAVGKTCDLARPTVTVTNNAETGKIVVSWKAVKGASRYEVYRSTTKDGTYKKLTTTTALTITNASISAGETYYYRVKAIFDGNSGADSAASVAVGKTCDLARPTVTITLNAKGKPVLSWKAVSGAIGYEIYRSTSVNGTYTKIGTVTGTQVTNSNVESGVTYYYRVRAISKVSGAHSAYSEIQSVTVE